MAFIVESGINKTFKQKKATKNILIANTANSTTVSTLVTMF